MFKKIQRRFSHAQTLAIGHFLVILMGALLLMLPISSRSGTSTDFLSSLFTSTSATCVTGLIVVDTGTHWNFFGQLVIITLIQIGGLGFVTMGVLFSMFLNKKISLRTRGLLQDSLNVDKVGGVIRLVKKALMGTLIIESIGAVLLMFRFIPEFGLQTGLWMSIFHSISAFCNAGFDILGSFFGAYSSLETYAGDILINMVIMSLIVIGGIGFIVWADLLEHKWHFRKYRLHTKIVLVTTFILIFGGAFLFYLFEKDAILAGRPIHEQILCCLFSSVTARTAGFNSVDFGVVRQSSALLMCVLMYIGGSPGSTAGGIKTTTVAVLFSSWFNSVRGHHDCNLFKRQVSKDTVRESSNVLIMTMTLALVSIMTICAIQDLNMLDVAFEVFSGLGTVGMTTGITRDLVPVSRVIIILMMYLGRIGSMSFAYSFFEKKSVPAVQNPVEKVMVG